MPGKFEGEHRYAEHYYEVMLEGGQLEDIELEDGTLVAVFEVTEDDVEKYPELDEKEYVAFYESEAGFWNETDVPESPDSDEDGEGDE